jgi:hypothetical protein
MQKFILGTLTVCGLLIALSAIAHASPATRLLDRDAAMQTTGVQPVDYFWNHRRYQHRAWDRRNRRWRYY